MQLQVAADAACESEFAAYDRELLNRFNVFFFDGSFGGEVISETGLLNQIENNMNLMLHPDRELYGEFADFYKILLEDGGVDSVALATDDDGMAYRQQAIMSMKDRYGIAFAENLLEECNLIKKNVEDGNDYKKSETDNQQALESLQEQKAEIDKENEADAREAASKENPAAVIEVQKNLGILELVKPKEFAVSQRQLDLSALPSGRALNKGGGCGSYSEDMLSNVLFNEYLMEMFSCASDSISEDTNQTNYQLEYLLAGNEHDVDNLKSVAERLLLVREGANFIYLITDGAKVAEAEATAALLVGYTGLVPLIEATKYAILLSWAFAESVLDVKRLLAGKKVSIIKNESNWQLALSNIGNAASDSLKDDEGGITYKHYLRLMLLIESQKNLAKRCLDLVEMIMRRDELYSDFRLDLMVCQMSLHIRALSKSVFYMLPFMQKYNWNNNSIYNIKRNFSYEMWQ